MPAPRTLEVARRSIETLRQLTSGDAPRTLIAEMVRAKIIAKMTRKKGLEPFHPASGMDTALAEALERGAVSPEVLGNILLVTDKTRLEIAERLVAYQEQEIPRAPATGEFTVAFHRDRGEIAERLRDLPPEISEQHLRLSAEFFTIIDRIRCDMQSPSNKICVDLADDEWCNYTFSVQEKMLLHALGHFGKLVGDPHAREFQPVAFPNIPTFPIRHIDEDEYDHLALAIFKIILEGDASSPLLTRTNTHVKTPIGPELKKKFGKVAETFRRKIADAENGVIVVHNSRKQRFNPLAQLPLILGNSALRDDPTVRKLREYPMILFGRDEPDHDEADVCEAWMTDGHEPSPFRTFTLNGQVVNGSVGLILGKAVDTEAADYTRQALLTSLIGYDIHGIQTPHQFEESVKAARGSTSIDDILTFFFTSVTHLDYPRLLNILEILFQHGIGQIPSACRPLITERFQAPASILDAYDKLTQTYKPVILSALPEETKLHSSLALYCDPPASIIGMEVEADAIARHLAEGDIVSLVDGTHYLRSRDPGKYDGAGDRAVQAFTCRMMQGKYEGLGGYSVVSLSEQESLLPLLLRIFGSDDEGKEDDDDDTRAGVKKMDAKLIALKRFNGKIILLVDQEHVDWSANDLLTLVGHLKRFKLKVICQSIKAIPGAPQVHIQPFSDQDLQQRIGGAGPEIRSHLLADVAAEDLASIAKRVQEQRHDPLQDPLKLCVEVLQASAASARATTPDAPAIVRVGGTHIAGALASVFSTTDPEKALRLLQKLDELEPELNDTIFGQREMIAAILRIFRDHLLGIRHAHRPTAALITGPTGIGKTEIMRAIAKFFALPFLDLPGSEFTEQHHADMLTGAPPGYHGQGAGKLTNFMKAHEQAIVFIDELEKGHPAFRQVLMNTLWDGRLTEKTGTTYHRPGFIYVGASNAGADDVHPGMKEREIHDVLATAFAKDGGPRVPEFIARFQLVHAKPIPEDAFLQAITKELRGIEAFPALQNFDVRVRDTAPDAVRHIFDTIAPLCQYTKGQRNMGFVQSKPENLFFNLRQIVYAVQQSTSRSTSALIEQLNRNKAASVWGDMQAHRVDLVLEGGEIVLKPVSETGSSTE